MTSTFAFPEINETECLDFLSTLIKFKSLTQTPGEQEITQYLTDQMRALGLDADIYPFNNGTRQNAIGRWKGTGDSSGKSKSLLFNGHVDTNPVSEGWTIDPWAGLYDKEFIYGIGVSNMKSGCAAYFCAVRELLKAGFKPKSDVVLTYVVGELQGGVGTVAAIEQGLMSADCFINCEPTDIRAITMHAESLIFSIELTGITRHMSAREEAVDVILAACKLIPILTEMKFSDARSERHESINRCHVGIVRAALGKEFVEWRPPQVADFLRMSGAARFAPGQTREGVLADIQRVVGKFCDSVPGLKVDVKQYGMQGMPSFEVDENAAVVKSLNQAYKETRAKEQPMGALPPPCFYGSDAGHLLKRLGMEGVVCGPGGRYNTRPDEKVDNVDYLDCIRMFMRVIVDICG
ncbi:hypothetical protein B7463_g12210, partial [Scytalidium lignicola]